MADGTERHVVLKREHQLSAAEQEALNNPDLFTIAETKQAISGFALRVGLSDDIHSALLAGVGDMEPSQREALLAGMTEMQLALENSDVPAVTIIEEQEKLLEIVKPTIDGDELNLSFRSVQDLFVRIDEQTRKRHVEVPNEVGDADGERVMQIVDYYRDIKLRQSTGPQREVAADRHHRNLLAALTVGPHDDESKKRHAKKRRDAAKEIARALNAPKRYGAPPKPSPESDKPDPLKAVTLEQIFESIDELSGGYDTDRIASMLDRLSSAGVDTGLAPEDFSHSVMEQIARFYRDHSPHDDPSTAVHILCAWGYVAKVDSEDLARACSTESQEPRLSDVSNAKKLFEEGIAKAVADGKELTIELNDELEEDDADDNTVPNDSLDEGARPDEPEGRSLDEEPAHVQLAYVLKEILPHAISSQSTTAIEGLLNPDARPGQRTPSRTIIIEGLRARISSHPEGVGLLDTLTEEGASNAAVKRFVGLGFMKGGERQEASPESLADQLSRLDPARREAYEDSFYKGIAALVEVLTGVRKEGVDNEPEATEAPDATVMQIDFSSGGPRLTGGN